MSKKLSSTTLVQRCVFHEKSSQENSTKLRETGAELDRTLSGCQRWNGSKHTSISPLWNIILTTKKPILSGDYIIGPSSPLKALYVESFTLTCRSYILFLNRWYNCIFQNNGPPFHYDHGFSWFSWGENSPTLELDCSFGHHTRPILHPWPFIYAKVKQNVHRERIWSNEHLRTIINNSRINGINNASCSLYSLGRAGISIGWLHDYSLNPISDVQETTFWSVLSFNSL